MNTGFYGIARGVTDSVIDGNKRTEIFLKNLASLAHNANIIVLRSLIVKKIIDKDEFANDLLRLPYGFDQKSFQNLDFAALIQDVARLSSGLRNLTYVNLTGWKIGVERLKKLKTDDMINAAAEFHVMLQKNAKVWSDKVNYLKNRTSMSDIHNSIVQEQSTLNQEIDKLTSTFTKDKKFEMAIPKIRKACDVIEKNIDSFFIRIHYSFNLTSENDTFVKLWDKSFMRIKNFVNGSSEIVDKLIASWKLLNPKFSEFLKDVHVLLGSADFNNSIIEELLKSAETPEPMDSILLTPGFHAFGRIEHGGVELFDFMNKLLQSWREFQKMPFQNVQNILTLYSTDRYIADHENDTLKEKENITECLKGWVAVRSINNHGLLSEFQKMLTNMEKFDDLMLEFVMVGSLKEKMKDWVSKLHEDKETEDERIFNSFMRFKDSSNVMKDLEHFSKRLELYERLMQDVQVTPMENEFRKTINQIKQLNSTLHCIEMLKFTKIIDEFSLVNSIQNNPEVVPVLEKIREMRENIRNVNSRWQSLEDDKNLQTEGNELSAKIQIKDVWQLTKGFELTKEMMELLDQDGLIIDPDIMDLIQRVKKTIDIVALDNNVVSMSMLFSAVAKFRITDNIRDFDKIDWNLLSQVVEHAKISIKTFKKYENRNTVRRSYAHRAPFKKLYSIIPFLIPVVIVTLLVILGSTAIVFLSIKNENNS